MFSAKLALRTALSASVAGGALLMASPVLAQSTDASVRPQPRAHKGAEGAVEAPAAANVTESDKQPIIVTGSRINRAGFSAPTPTTVVGATELAQAGAVNLQQALNELPQMRNSVSPSQSQANTSAGTAPVELRGLGISRTLTLVNGRRFIGDNNLNFVPTNLVQRVEVVTGGASAAWGSGAVAGVVNIILNDKLEGVTLGGETGISTRGDGARYKVDGSFGTHFAGGRGHFMVGAEYVDDKGIGIAGKADRPWFGAGLVSIGNGQFEVRPNVNDLTAAGQPITYGGTILTGALAGNVFNPDGSIRPATPADAMGLYGDNLIVASPVKRLASFARATYDLGGATLWADFTYGRSSVHQPFLPDPASKVLAFAVSANNPFLSQDVRDQLAAAGESSFLMARFSRDAFLLTFDANRKTAEGSIGIDGSFGGGWKYSAYFTHGELDDRQRVFNSSIPANFANAINAVSVGGQIVCGVNADADPANDDPACVPFNPFGEGAASAAAINYVTGTQSLNSTDKLDAGEAKIEGEPLSLWAGPISIAAGVDARWESRTGSNEAIDRAGVFGTPLFQSPVQGRFNVKEAFGEALVPLANSDALKVDLNGAARYSDYSLSGGIWSWKLGGTARIFHDLLLRATRSRDIRAPGLGDLFAVNSLNIRKVVDNDPSHAGPGYNPNPSATVLSGGNTALVPEVAKTWTIGGSYTPSFLSGFAASVDYYDISIGNAIDTPTPEVILALCAQGDAESCSRITRDATGTITEVRATSQNISQFRTSGFDFEAAYRLALARVIPGAGGSLSFRALANRVTRLRFVTGSTVSNTLGDVGDQVGNGLPKWRANFSAVYQNDRFSLDGRIRYVGGGVYNHLQDIVNNHIGARIYTDVGAEFRPTRQFSLSLRANNLFDVKPPLVTTTYNAFYDMVGRYFTAGVRFHF